MNTASDLKYTRAVRNILSDWMVSPSEDFVKLACSEVFSGKRITPAIKEQFTLITKNAFQQLISEKINDRLKMAMEPTEGMKANSSPRELDQDRIITTEEELEGYRIVRAILREVTDPKRVVMRDSRSYCAILLDIKGRLGKFFKFFHMLILESEDIEFKERLFIHLICLFEISKEAVRNTVCEHSKARLCHMEVSEQL